MTRNLHRLTLIATAIVGTTVAAQTEEAPPPPAAAAAPTRYAAKDDAPVAPDLRTDVGWNRDWALLFSLNNPFAGGGILSSHSGTISGMYYLSDTSGIRAGLTLSRSNTPVTVIKTTVITGPDTVITYNASVPGTTESNTVAARGEYLMRLGTGSIAPYFGGGAAVGYTLNRQIYTDELSVPNQRTQFNDRTQVFEVFGTGVVGAEWRVHPQFALFAEYGLSLSIWRTVNGHEETTVEVTGGGTPSTTRTINEFGTNTFLGLTTGLFQGGSLGVQVMF